MVNKGVEQSETDIMRYFKTKIEDQQTELSTFISG